jgi:hypothetical protein
MVGIWKGDLLNPTGDGFEGMVYATRLELRDDHSFQLYTVAPDGRRTVHVAGKWARKGQNLLLSDEGEPLSLPIAPDMQTIYWERSRKTEGGTSSVFRRGRRSPQAEAVEAMSASHGQSSIWSPQF